MSNKLIEQQNVTRDYDFNGVKAIVDTPTGRVYIEDGFGGQDSIAGGCVRWRHGLIIDVPAGTTLDDLNTVEDGFMATLYERVKNTHVDGYKIHDHSPEAIAKSVGLY